MLSAALDSVIHTVSDSVARPAVRSAYHAQQASLRYSLLGFHVLLRALTASIARAGGKAGGPPSAEAVAALRREYEALLSRDVENAEAGLYPSSLLFQLPWLDYASTLPRFALDLPRLFFRARRGDHQDLPEDVDRRRFPAYFRRTFHWQTDGYLSRHSAALYDVSVELLFMGCADVMRRQVIPPMARFARKRRGPLRILDVGCGTGRTLGQIAEALPGHQYFGVDLSPFYLEQARERLAKVPEVSLVVENGEKLPYRDDYFDVVTSTYLFHELPRKVRGRVMAELSRVLRPGGLLVVEDSAQLAEADDLAFFLEAFPAQMHEPFYRDYMKDDLAEVAAKAGFRDVRTERAWLSKVVTANASPEPRA